MFEDVGFEIEMIGRVRIISCGKRWRKSYKEKGDTGLKDARGTSGNGGRPSTKDLTTEQLLAKKDAEIAYWKSEAELLKKLEKQEGQVKKGKLSTIKIFGIINNLIKNKRKR